MEVAFLPTTAGVECGHLRPTWKANEKTQVRTVRTTGFANWISGTCLVGLCAQIKRKGSTHRRRVVRLAEGTPLTAQDGDTIAVVGAGGNVGRLVTQRLCSMGKFQVNGVLRDKERARGWASDQPGLTLFEADTRDASALDAPLRDASAVVCTTGVPAFGISGQWEKGNHPETVDHFGVKNVAHIWSTAPGPKRRFVLMSSIGVTRRDGFPYSILNGGGVLDAKARGEAAVSEMAVQRGFGVTIVRPGQLFGGPYENNRYLGTLFQLDKDSGTNAVMMEPGDTAVGDTLRSSLAGVLVRCLFTNQSQLEFSVVNDKGPPPSEEEIDQLLENLADPKGEANEQLGKRLGLAQETLGQAVKNAVSGKVFDE